MRYLSVCSGIEAATVAWHPLGWVPAAFSEIEAFPRAVLAHHYPEVPLHGDFTTINGYEYGTVDLLVGGTPCQSYSVAGLRGGLDDPRGDLMLGFGRLAKRLGAKWLVWENVPGVLSSNGGRDFGAFLGMLVELGYGFAYRVLDAQHFGVPQRRRRVFVIACLGDWRAAAAVLFERHSLQRHPAPSREARQNVTGTISSRTTGGGGLGTDFELGGGLQPVVGTLLANGKAAGSATQQDAEAEMLVPTAFGGNNQAGPIDVATARNACRSASGRLDFETETFLVQPIAFSCKDNGRDATADLAPTLRSMADAGSHQNGGGQLAVSYAIQAGALRTNPSSGPDGVGVQSDIAYTLEARAEVQAVCFSNKDHGPGVATELVLDHRPDERMTFAASDYKNGAFEGCETARPLTTSADRTRAAPVCVTGDITHTLKAEGFDASEDGTGRGQPIISIVTGCDGTVNGPVPPLMARSSRGGAQTLSPGHQTDGHMIGVGVAVRRLTPRECERLQGFPDSYTHVPVKKVGRERLLSPRAGYDYAEINGEVWQLAADGPRYKALGNSMAVPCMAWIGERIQAVIDLQVQKEAA